ncbi:MAG: hypothetical protein ACOX81_05920 [Candidatus Heteroscillospira sp.]|jgi:hypothetical protein
MKKRLFCLVLVLLLSAGCSAAPEAGLYIAPSEFSEETEDVLKLFSSELQFYDLSFDDSVQSFSMDIWLYEDGEWVDAGGTHGGRDFLPERFALRMLDTSCDIYIIDDDGSFTKGSFPLTAIDPGESFALSSWHPDAKTELELNQETALWVKRWLKGSSMEASYSETPFRDAPCDAGIAVTLTLSDQPAD